MIKEVKEAISMICIGLVVLLVLPIFWGFTIVKSSEEGVVTKWGDIKDKELKEGVHFYWRIPTDIQKIDIRERTKTIETTTVSKEGLKFGITITVRYSVKGGKSSDLLEGLETDLGDLVISYANSTIDDVATGKEKNELYAEKGRQEVVMAVKEKLNSELSNYVDVKQVILQDIMLPEGITEAIQKQQAAEETIKEKEKMKEVAKKDADIKRIEAQGIADANRIIQGSLTKEYLQYEAIQKLNPDAEKIYIDSNGLMPVINP